jgi:type II secretory pathway pseudopilin PulG
MLTLHTQSVATVPGSGARHRREGFTIVELLIAILVIGTLIGILLIGIRAARSFTGSVIDETAVEGLAKGVEAFRTDHGFVPPLVREWMRENPPGVLSFNRDTLNYNDAVATSGTSSIIQVARLSDAADETRLRTFANPPTATAALTFDNRFSEVSLSYYLGGILNVPFSGTFADLPIDGIAGPGGFKADRRGTFDVPSTMQRAANLRIKAGATYGPYIDTEKVALKVQRAVNSATGADLDAAGRAQLLVDRNGIAIRYYQWLNGDLVSDRYVVEDLDDLRVPPVIGRRAVTIAGQTITPPADQDLAQNSALRTNPDVLNWAIVGAGPNRMFGDEDIDLIARTLSKPTPTNDEGRAILRNEAASDNIVKIGGVDL